MTQAPYGFRIVGATSGRRRLVNAGAALLGYASCDPRAEIDREAYLSAFTFGEAFRAHLEDTGSTAGYGGPCCADYIWLDIDRPEAPERALRDARALAGAILERYRTLDDDGLLLFFSGSKGYHVGLPTALWGPGPSPDFNAVARRFAESLAGAAGATVDASVYDKVRAFRAPNSRHPRTGLHKRRLSLKELMHLPADHIRQLAADPEPFALPEPPAASEEAARDWAGAE